MTDEEIKIQISRIYNGTFRAEEFTSQVFIKLFAKHAEESTRETLAAWIIHNGFATGHGDTIEALLEELREQIEEIRNEKTS